MQRRKSLLVGLDVSQPSIVEITAHEHVQLDRLNATPRGVLAERQGPLLAPGTTRVSLDAGRFCFRTLSNTQLRVVQGGVATTYAEDPKDPWPLLQPFGRGDSPDGEMPSFAVIE